VPSGKLVGLVEGYRTARVSIPGSEKYSFDVPMPGETFLAPPGKIRSFVARSGIGALAGVKGTPAPGPQNDGTVAQRHNQP
jgi:hypothetical protein